MSDIIHDVCCDKVTLIKVSTNTHGGLRFKVIERNKKPLLDLDDKSVVEAYAAAYAEQISTERRKFSVSDVMGMPGFKVTSLKDHSRCLKEREVEKQSPPVNSEGSSTTSSSE